MRDGEPHKLFSMKLGAVGLTERFLASNPPKKRELENLRAEIALALDHPLRKIRGETWQAATGTSGTILNLAGLLAFQDGRASGQKPLIELKKLSALNEMMARIGLEERVKLPIISPQRAEVIVAGGLILECVMRALGIERLDPCLYALREGVIIDYLREIEAESLPPVPDVMDKRLRGVFAVGRRFGYEENHALQVARLAEKMFDSLALVYNFRRHWRTLLSAAAILHDVGYHISHESHHKHSFYLIKNSEITGFSEAEKLLIANIARYHRGSVPKDKHADYTALADADRALVWQMGAILRVAEALDHSYENRVKDLHLTHDRQSFLLELAGESGCDGELQAVERKKEMFETAFGRKLKVAAGSRARKS
jgi:exopolyphosphatase / guanosine-5'-triphosphate,3'-diphosphate pyrophosphatase